MSEIFAERNFHESAHSRNFLHFTVIYFRELKGNFFPERINFRELNCLKNFAGINFRELRGKIP